MHPRRLALLVCGVAIGLIWASLAGTVDRRDSAPADARLHEASWSHESLPAVRPALDERSTTAGADRTRLQRLPLLALAVILCLAVLGSRPIRRRPLLALATIGWRRARSGRGPPARFLATA